MRARVAFPPAHPALSFLLRMFFRSRKVLGPSISWHLGRLLIAMMNRGEASATTVLFAHPSARITGRGLVQFGGGFYLNSQVELRTGNAAGTIQLGTNVWVESCSILSTSGRGRLELGDRAYVGPFCVMYAHGGIIIGKDALIGPHCTFAAENHGMAPDRPMNQQPLAGRGIRVADNVWIGANVTICDGVTIGTGSVVAAGAVVIRDVPPFTLVGGVPAGPLRDLLRQPPVPM